MKYRLDLVGGTKLWSEDVSDLCHYLRCIGSISFCEAFGIIKEFFYEGRGKVEGGCYTITKETEADV